MSLQKKMALEEEAKRNESEVVESEETNTQDVSDEDQEEDDITGLADKMNEDMSGSDIPVEVAPDNFGKLGEFGESEDEPVTSLIPDECFEGEVPAPEKEEQVITSDDIGDLDDITGLNDVDSEPATSFEV